MSYRQFHKLLCIFEQLLTIFLKIFVVNVIFFTGYNLSIELKNRHFNHQFNLLRANNRLNVLGPIFNFSKKLFEMKYRHFNH